MKGLKEEMARVDYTKGNITKGNTIGFFGGFHADNINMCLSNWYFSYFTLNLNTSCKVTFTCAEQALMYCKAFLFKDTMMAENILSSHYNPIYYKKCGRNVDNYDDRIWSNARGTYMLFILKQKFLQNADMKEYLLSTGNKQLVECSPYDRIWGAGLSLSGSFDKGFPGDNLLGKTLMDVRKIINQNSKLINS